MITEKLISGKFNKEKHTYAMLMVNLQRVSSVSSFVPLSTPIKFTLPVWLPVAMYLESGENVTVQESTKKRAGKDTAKNRDFVLITSGY